MNEPASTFITFRLCLFVFHLDCIGLSEVFTNYLNKNGLEWTCYRCERADTEEVGRKLEALQGKVAQSKKDLEGRINRLEVTQRTQVTTIDKLIETVTEVNKINDTKIINIAQDLVYLQARDRRNNFLISGIPKKESEDLKHIIVKVTEQLRVPTVPQDISKVHRIKPRREVNQTNEQILAVFSKAEVAEQVFGAYIALIKNKQYLTADKIGFTGNNSRIYINKQLPPVLSALYRRAKNLKREGKVQNVSTRTTAIAVQINERWHRVSTEEQLNELIKPPGGQTKT